MVKGRVAGVMGEGGYKSPVEMLAVTLNDWTVSYVQFECKCPSMRILVLKAYFLSLVVISSPFTVLLNPFLAYSSSILPLSPSVMQFCF